MVCRRASWYRRPHLVPLMSAKAGKTEATGHSGSPKTSYYFIFSTAKYSKNDKNWDEKTIQSQTSSSLPLEHQIKDINILRNDWYIFSVIYKNKQSFYLTHRVH